MAKTEMKNLGAEHENLDYRAYQAVKEMIMERRLLPGEKIPQERLAQELGISRTPLINALKYLEHEKLIKSIPRRGYFVRLFTRKEMIYIFELREVLEGLAARRACFDISNGQIRKMERFFGRFKTAGEVANYKAYAREDRRFHNFVVEVGGKEFLKSILQTYNVIAFSYQVVEGFEGLVRPPAETMGEHLAIIEAISQRQAAQSEKLMRSHLARSRATLEKHFEEEKKKAGRKKSA